jgi:hypothetical protein
MGDQTDASGRTGADARGLDSGRVDTRRPDAGSRTTNQGDWTPDGPDTGRAAGPRATEPHGGHRMVNQDRRPTPGGMHQVPTRRLPTPEPYFLPSPTSIVSTAVES